jgi:hypothetical protein
MCWPVGDKSSIDKTANPLNKYEALALLYLQKQDLNGCSPEDLVGRYVEAYDSVLKEFARQQEVKKRRLNPLPL